MFDPELITVDPQGFSREPGGVRVSPREVVLAASPRSEPTVHLLTAEVPFDVTLSVSVLERGSGTVFPLRLKVWNPRGEVAAEAWYTSDGRIFGAVRQNQVWAQPVSLGAYTVGGSTQVWRITRDETKVILRVAGEGGTVGLEVERRNFPQLFEQATLSLTILASAPGETSSVVTVRDPRIAVLRQTLYGTTVRSEWFRPIVGVMVIVALLYLLRHGRMTMGWWKVHTGDAIVLLFLTGSTMLIGWWLSELPGHPLDVRAVGLWSHIAREHGPAAVTAYSLLATEGNAHGGQPYSAMTFPYPPLLTYLFMVAGKIAPVGRVEQTVKLLATFGVAGGGAVVFTLLRRMRVALGTAAAATGSYVLNPAILFDSAVWGQTDAFVGFFLLLGAAGGLLQSSSILWAGALLASLTKQTGAMLALPLVALGFVRIGPRRMLRSLPASILGVFLILAPLLLSGVHPASTYRPLATKLVAFGTIRGMEVVNAIISQSSFTLWSVLTGLEDVHGLARMAFPDFIPSRFGLSYFALSRVVFALFMLVLGLLSIRWRKERPGAWWGLLATCAVAMAVLLTRVQPRYLYFGVMFTAAALPWLPRLAGGAVLVTLSTTMLAAMWGMLVFTSVWYPGLLPLFEPDRSWLNAAAATMLGTDLGITIGGLLNTIALLGLLWVSWRAGRTQRPW
jgi:hypothetical protein